MICLKKTENKENQVKKGILMSHAKFNSIPMFEIYVYI